MPTIHNIPNLPFPTLPSLSISPTSPFLSSSHLTPSHVTYVAREWFGEFSKALSNGDSEGVLGLMMDDCWWRDMLALTWDLRTFHGRPLIQKLLEDRLSTGAVKVTNVRLDEDVDLGKGAEAVGGVKLERPAEDIIWITLFFRFDTGVGEGFGIVRLMPTVPSMSTEDFVWKAHTIYTNLESLHNYPERIGPLRSFAPNHGKWESERLAEVEFRDPVNPAIETNPDVLIIGAGHSGLEVAARLKAVGVKSLCVERNERVGDSWRGRYDVLCLHDPVWYENMPFLPFPSTWPIFTPAPKLANWLEFYAEALDLNVWTSTTVTRMTQDEETKVWEVDVVRIRKRKVKATKGNSEVEGEEVVEERKFRVKHVVVACGLGGAPNMPSYPGMDTFKGKIIHSTQYKTASDHVDSLGLTDIIIMYTYHPFSPGHDIAADHQSHGIDVTLFQRGSTSTYIMSIHNGYDVLFRGLFFEPTPTSTPPPIDLSDRIMASFPHFMATELNRRRAKEIAELDKELLAGDTGASQLIIDGKIKLKSTSEISSFSPTGIIFEDGSTLEADVVVFATGIGSPHAYLTTLLPPSMTARITPLWGLDAEGELNGLYKEIGVEGLWSMIGSLGLCRFHSKHIALQIKAMLEGIHGGRYS
ncbi:hypothetical protein CVT24_006553 [Panaeolus cyanescens]|uniref:FAD/NAD(P)-binding domain-containing protein n=1 Tax=Panaeolus cyanescens TaxID=181874 RepID=A0A409WBW7_9AGAR|nr:hypothetical protein CVT24_006553 [Panaeolus cyanescens]